MVLHEVNLGFQNITQDKNHTSVEQETLSWAYRQNLTDRRTNIFDSCIIKITLSNECKVLTCEKVDNIDTGVSKIILFCCCSNEAKYNPS